MEDQNIDELDIETQQEETETVETETDEETVESLRERLAKAEEVAKNQKIRAEKAEAKAKEKKATEDFSSKDIIAITRAGINDEDLEYVQKWAKLEGKSISEALNDSELKEILSVKEEKRKTALASNVATSKRPINKQSDETVLSNANKGIFPDDPAQLAEARLNQKIGKKIT